MPLVSAVKAARSPFLRCESYRLLASLYNPKLNPQSSELDTAAMAKTKESAGEVCLSIIAGLKDEDMLKAKRVREVLKACEKILEFAKATSMSLPNVDELATTVNDVGTKADGKGIKATVEKLDSLFNALKEASDVKMDEDEAEERDNADEGGGKGKKDKKKKKKKKRGKK